MDKKILNSRHIKSIYIEDKDIYYFFTEIRQSENGDIYIHNKHRENLEGIPNDISLHVSGQMNLKTSKGTGLITQPVWESYRHGFPQEIKYLELCKFISPKNGIIDSKIIKHKTQNVLLFDICKLNNEVCVGYIALLRGEEIPSFPYINDSDYLKNSKILLNKRIELPYLFCKSKIDLHIKISTGSDYIYP